MKIMMHTRIPHQQHFPKKYRNCRSSQNKDDVMQTSTTSELDYIDEDLFALDNVNVPKMELLNISYVNLNDKVKPPNATNCLDSKPSCVHKKSKYLVYKKHNGFGATTINQNKEKLQYVNDVDIKAKTNKKKYTIFDTKKKSNKFETIQYYFDNKSYEQYVDNKLYGVVQQQQQKEVQSIKHEPSVDNRSKSWEYRQKRRVRMMTSPPPPPPVQSAKSAISGSLKKENCRIKPKENVDNELTTTRHKSMNDINRINQLFLDQKLQNGESPSCNHSKSKYLVHKRVHKSKPSSDSTNEQINKRIQQIFDKPVTTLQSGPINVTIKNIEKEKEKNKALRSHKTCGYKNCKFSNCPMSSSASSASSSSDLHLKEESIEITLGNQNEDKDRQNAILNNHLEKLNNENVKVISSKIKEIDLESNRMIIEKCVAPINVANMKFSNMQKNILLKNNPQVKYDDKVNINNKIKNEENSIKIFITSQVNEPISIPSSSTSSTISSASSITSDSDKDDGYCDQSISSGEHPASSSSHVNRIQVTLGCDGALFWNSTCYDDTTLDCEKCCFSSKSNNSNGLRKNYLCECGIMKTKIESFTPRPRSMDVTDHTSMLGPDSGISVSGDTTISSPDSDLNSQDSDERRLKRGHVLSELLETERIYVAEMNSILKGYRDEMQSEEMSSLVPPGLQDKADILFGNLHELYAFHSETFLKDLENCISTTELVALCFVQRRDTFFRLYSYYCQNIPRSERLRETLVDTHLFLQECQKKLGHKLPLAAYLLKPVQRITKYQLLLKDLLKFSDTGTCSRELQKALDCMLVVLKCVNDSMHQIAITGFPADLSQQGELLLQDSFQIWTESKKDLRLRLKTQQRHIFLYQKALLFCKHGSKAAGHNKSTYQFKHWLQMSQIGLTENVRGDSRRFEVWLQGRQEVHTIQANTLDIKNKWVTEIKRVLLNQLEELKGEKIKQYGGGVINHKPLKHAASWDMPQSLHSINNRTQSCDQDIMRIPNVNEDMISATGISSSSSEHDNQETNAWSSDYSNSEDEFSHFEENVIPGTKFKSLADYCAMGHSEVSMKEGDIVELLKVGCAGWWFVNVISNNHEGWAPAAYLEPVNRKSSRMRAKSQDRLNDH